MKARRRGGVLRMDLADNEVAILANLFDEVQPLLSGSDTADPVVRRLFPAGYADDPVAAVEFADLVRTSLAQERTERLQACRDELPAGGGRVELPAEASDRWIRVLNDLRLALGTRLDVTQDSEPDAALPAVSVYHWLGAIQETLVQQLMHH